LIRNDRCPFGVGDRYPFRIDSHEPESIVAVMANKGRGWYWRLTCQAGVYACLSLTLPAGAAEGDMKVGPSAHAQTEHREGIVALLDRLEREIAEDHLAAPQDDNADATIQAIVALLPNAPASEIKMVLDMPGHLERRAGEAEAAGHHDEARRFAALGDALSGTQTKTAVGSQPATTTAPPLNAGDSSLQLNQSAPGGAAKLSPLPGGRLASREASSPTSGDGVQPSVSEIVVYPAAVGSAHAVGKPRSPATVSATNSRCRAITLKIEIGEQPSDAERSYLRDGCQHG
jgi:hypothetical protein